MASTPANVLNSIGLRTEVLNLDKPAQYTSLFVYSPEDLRLQQSFEPVAKAHKEEMISRVNVKELQRDGDWTIVLTDNALYKCVPNNLNNPRKRKLLTEFFDVTADSSNPRQFNTLLWKDSMKTSVKASWSKLAGRAGASVDLAALLQKREYICSSELQRDQFVWIFNRVLRDRWQQFLESTVIPTPEYYQQHHLVVKKNKSGANQERLLVISNEFIYNMEMQHKADKPEVDVKWAVPIMALSAIALEEGCRLDFFFDQDELELYNTRIKRAGKKPRKNLLDKSKLNDTYQFSFPDDDRRASFVAVIRHLYEKLTREHNAGVGLDLKVLVNAQSTSQQHKSSLHYDITHGSSLGQNYAAANMGNNTAQQGNALQRKGSSLQVALEQHRQQQAQQEYLPILSEPLEKITHGNVDKAHIKHFALYPDLTIKWGDSATRFKYNAKVIGVMKAQEIQEALPPERRPNFFALRTTEKPLYLLATDASSAATWRSTIDAYSGATLDADTTTHLNGQANGGNNMQTSGSSEIIGTTNNYQEHELLKMQLTVPVIKGYLTKFVRGGKSEHDRFFSLFADGTISWGDNPNKLKYSGTVIEVDQDISGYTQAELPHHRAVRFIRIKTDTKHLELLCPSQESADRWVAFTNKVIDPSYEDDLLEDDEEADDGELVNGGA